MKKITIGLLLVLSVISNVSFAANSASSKKDVSIPCYNGGLNFGLAGYEVPAVTQSDLGSTNPQNCPPEAAIVRDTAKIDYK